MSEETCCAKLYRVIQTCDTDVHCREHRGVHSVPTDDCTAVPRRGFTMNYYVQHCTEDTTRPLCNLWVHGK